MTLAAEGASNPTHKALSITEILCNVYKMLAEQNKRRTLASMAQVCRAFTEPALDMIWEHIVGLEPFGPVLQVARSRLPGSCPGCAIVKKFELYARRVREFTQNNNDFDHNFLYFLTRRNDHCVPPRPIFPNLRKLNVLYIGKRTSLDVLEIIITPSLRYLRIDFAEDDNDLPLEHEPDLVRKALTMLTRPYRTTNNQLERAQLRHLVFFAFVPSAHLDQLMSLRQLRVLHIHGITPEHTGGIDYLSHLSTLPHLQDMSLTLQENEFFHPLPHDGFPSLERLFIQGNAVTIQYFLSALPPGRLKYLDIMDDIDDWASYVFGPGEMRDRMEGWRDCFSALVRQAATLTNLGITLGSDTANPGDIEECGRGLPLLSVIEPLLELRELKKVQLNGFIEMPFSDAAVDNIVAAWRKIQYLVFPTPLAEVQQPCITSLKLLMLFCPDLTFLSMGFDTKSPMGDAEPAQNPHALPLAICHPFIPISHPLQVLDLCETDLKWEHVPWLASQLKDWFPMLELVTAVRSQDAAAAVTATLLQLKRNRSGQGSAAIRRLSLSPQKPASAPSRKRSSSL